MLKNAHQYWTRARLRPPLAHYSVLSPRYRIGADRSLSTDDSIKRQPASRSIDRKPGSSLNEGSPTDYERRHIGETFREKSLRHNERLSQIDYASLREDLIADTCPERHAASTRGSLEDGNPDMEGWRINSRAQLLMRVLVQQAGTSWGFWLQHVAALRTQRLSVVLLQLILRENMLLKQPPNRFRLDLPDAQTWQTTLENLEKKGINNVRLRQYAHILAGPTNTERIRRFLDTDDFKPLFMFTFLLRGPIEVEHLGQLAELVKYARRWYTASRPGLRHWQSSIPLLTSDLGDLVHPVRLLIAQAYRVDPRLLPDIAALVSHMIINMSLEAGRNADETHIRQSRVFNRALGLFRQSNYGLQFKRKLPAAYTWAALEILLNTSASLQRPCLTSFEGFRAIKDVMAGQIRDPKDLRIIPRLAKTWPPYILPGDGMDEGADPEENWSRTVLASAFMQENGFSKEEADLALDVLQGMSPDGTPTIVQPETVPRRQGMRLWEASIIATRDSVEAWQRFQRCPGDPSAKPWTPEYVAMFNKLAYRDVQPFERALPGDQHINFPNATYNSLTELERLRLQPPTIEELYMKMKANDVPVSPRCLRLLIRHARTMEEVSKYVFESDLPTPVKKAFLCWEDWDGQVFAGKRANKIAVKLYPVFVTTMMRLTRPSPKRILQWTERGAEVVRAAGSKGKFYMAPLWHDAVKALGRSSRQLRGDPEMFLGATLHTVQVIEEAGQMSLATFLAFANTVHKIIIARLDVTGRWALDDLINLYESQERKDQQRQNLPGLTDDSGAAAIDQALEQGLVASLALAANTLKRNFANLLKAEERAQLVLEDHLVPPLERMANRQDPVQAEQVQLLVSTLAHLGEFEEAARVLKWALTQWMETDVFDALCYLDEDPGLHGALCVFRRLVEPMLPSESVNDIHSLAKSAQSPCLWPTAEQADEWFETHVRKEEAHLETVLDYVQQRRMRREDQQGDEGEALLQSSGDTSTGGSISCSRAGGSRTARPSSEPTSTSANGWQGETSGLRFATGKI